MSTGSSHAWVLAPGTLCTPEVFEPVLRHLGVPRDRCRYLDLTAPKVEDYDAGLRELVKGDEIVCGFSLGAMVLAHNLGALHRAKAVVLLACNPFPDPAGNRAARETTRDRILAGGARDWVADGWSAMSSDPSVQLMGRVAGMAAATSARITAQTELAASRPGAAKDLEGTELPLVFVTGGEDKLTPPERLRPISKAAAHSVLIELDGLGHFALLGAPDRVAAAIELGLATVLAPTEN